MPDLAFLIESDNWDKPPALVPPAKPTRILVLGAGMGGLVAGYELMNQGYDVRILEARATAGGRVQTLREGFTDGLYADAGATFIPDAHGLPSYYAGLLKLSVVDFSGSDLPEIYYVKGQRIQYSAGSDTPVDWPYALTAAEKAMGLAKMQTTYGSPPDLLGAPKGSAADAVRLKLEDALSLDAYMTSKGASAGAVELLDVGFNQLMGEGPSSYSAAVSLSGDHYISSNIQSSGPDIKRVEGGNDLFPAALAAKLGSRISYSTEVLQIAQDNSGVRVTCRAKDGQQETSADYVICTLPFSILRNIPVIPGYGAALGEVLRTLSYTSVTRIFLQMREQFWRTQGLSGKIVSDQPMTVVYPGYNPPSEQGTLGLYMASANARRIGALSLAEQIEFALGQIEAVYPEVRQNFVAGVSKVWDADPFAKGAYASFTPGQMESFLPVMAQPQGRIYFAGEHASTLTGWIQGAMASGLRAAQSIAVIASK
jgi:monoamine oxidase